MNVFVDGLEAFVCSGPERGKQDPVNSSSQRGVRSVSRDGESRKIIGKSQRRLGFTTLKTSCVSDVLKVVDPSQPLIPWRVLSILK